MTRRTSDHMSVQIKLWSITVRVSVTRVTRIFRIGFILQSTR